MKANQCKIALSLMNESTLPFELYIEASQTCTQSLLFVPQHLSSLREQKASMSELTGQMSPLHGPQFHQRAVLHESSPIFPPEEHAVFSP